MRRRNFIALVGGAAAVPLAHWPMVTHAQQQVQTKRIGVLMNFRESDPEGQARLTAFVHAMSELGWTDGRNARLYIRWAAGDRELFRRYARELVGPAPDAILAGSSVAAEALQQATHAVPIVFAGVIDPVGAGLVESLAQPGGNITGFIAYEYSIAAKWLELLKEIAPTVTRVAVLRDAAIAAGIGQFAAIQAVGPIEIMPIPLAQAATT
jgi:putative ABC transport system substrate-binding protein